MGRSAFAERLQNLSGEAIKDILKVIQIPGMISFAGGMPSPDAFPVKELNEIMGDIIKKDTTDLFQYGSTEGYNPLREYIANWLSEKGMQVSVDEILITTGSQQGIELTGKTFLNCNDRVVVEDPTYLAAIQIYKSYEAQFSPVSVDNAGVIPDSLQSVLASKDNKLIYLVPTFQNPTGITMSSERRQKLLEVISEYDISVVEDDPYGELRYSEEVVPTLKSFDKNGQVIYLGSFSKIISPGLRVGYAVAPKDIIDKMATGKQGADTHTTNLSQVIVYEFCRRGLLKPHIEKIRKQYKEKRDLMLKCLEQYFPTEVKWTTPDGGLFIWVELPEQISSQELLKKAADEKVAFVPGNTFYVSGGGENTFRLNFSNPSLEEIDQGMQKLGQVIESYLEK